MLLAVVVAGERGGPQEVDGPVGTDEPAAGEGGRGSEDERRSAAARLAPARPVVRVMAILLWSAGRRIGPVRWASDSATAGAVPGRVRRSGCPLAPSRGGPSGPRAGILCGMHARPAALALAVPLLLATGLLAAGAADPAPTAAAFPAKDSRYHDYAEMVATIKAAQTAHPDIVKVQSIGKSYQGRDIWAVKVSDNVATDENEPEVMFDGLHHAREHLSAEQALAVLSWLTTGYGTDGRITRLVDEREIWIIPMVNPDGGEYDIAGAPYRAGARTASRTAARPRSARTSTATTATTGRAAAARRLEVVGDVPRLDGLLDTGGPGHPRLHGQPPRRRRQQIKAAITFHTAGEQILWPYGYTQTDVPADMTTATTPRWSRSASTWPRPTATRRCSRARCTSPTATRSTGRTATQRIWMYTMELYPSHSKVSGNARFYPADELIARETTRNKAAILYLIEHAGCLYSRHRQGRGELRPVVRRLRGRDAAGRSTRSGTDTATAGGGSAATRQATARQAGTRPCGLAGARHRPAGRGDVERQRPRRQHEHALGADRTLPDRGGDADLPLLLRAQRELVVERLLPGVRRAAGRERTLVRQELGAANNDNPAWASVSVSMTPWAGETGPDRVRGRRRRGGEHGRGRRGRRAGHPAVAARSGRRPGADTGTSSRHRPATATEIVPPWASTSPRAMASPSPEPRESAPFTNRSKTCGTSAGIDARAGVGDAQDERRPGDPPGDRHAAARRRVAEAVGDEVGEDLADPHRDRPRRSAGRRGSRSSTRRPRPPRRGRNERATSAISRSGSVGSGWSGSMPASESEMVRRSSMSRSRTRVSSRIGARCAASGRVDPVERSPRGCR